MRGKRIAVWLLSITGAFISAGCGGSGGDGDGTGENSPAVRVEDLLFDQSTILRGRQTGLDINFSFANDQVLGEGRNVVVALRLHDGLSFARGSGTVDSFAADKPVDEVILPCPSDGGQLIIFTMNSEELIGASDPPGPASAKLQTTVQAGTQTGPVIVEARAGYDLAFAACDESFVGEETWTISVLP